MIEVVELGAASEQPGGAETRESILSKLGIANISGVNTGDQDLSGKVDKDGAKVLTDINFTSAKDTKLSGIQAGATANDTDLNLKNRANHTGTQSADTITDGVTNKVFTATEKTKLAGLSQVGQAPDLSNYVVKDGVKVLSDENYTTVEKSKLSGLATGATANSTDTVLKDRANHTGVQAASTITQDATHRFATDTEKTAWNAKADTSAIPTAATLVQDATHRFTTDAEKTAWNAKADTSAIPTAATLTQDATHRFVSDTEKTTWNGKANLGDIPAAETGATIYTKLVNNATPIPAAILPDFNFDGTTLTGDGSAANKVTVNFSSVRGGYAGTMQDLYNLISSGSGTTNTTPAAPTLAQDDTANTITASHALGTSEIVMSVNDAAYVAYSPISVGDVARAAGYWKFKIKSATGRNESAVVSSQAFTVAATAPAGATAPITAWHGISQGTKLDTNSFTFTTGTTAFGFAYADQKIATGVSGWVQFDGVFSPGSTDTAYLALTNNPTSTSGNDTGAVAWFTNSNKVVSRIDGVWNDGPYLPATGQNGAVTRVRIRVDATTAYVESSIDGGTTWAAIRSGARPTGDVYIKIIADVNKTGVEIHNLIGNGLS